NNQTIDFFVVQAANILAAGTRGATGGNYLAANFPGWFNVVIHSDGFMPPTAANNTHIPSHEPGHAIWNGGNPLHSGTNTHVFFGQLTPEPNVLGSKRIPDADARNNASARATTGPGNAAGNPVLLQQN